MAERFLIGIDEAGRGPLAGPLVVGGVMVSSSFDVSCLSGIRDSKKLSAKQREEWFEFLTRHTKIQWAAARVLPRTIDTLNISGATHVGVRKVHKKLTRSKERAFAYLDGGLRLPSSVPQETIIKGDELNPLISAASIIAKVTRDRIMLRLHKKYPHYGFDRHKGYGTLQHRAMLARYGRCEIHRTSFRCM